MRTTVVAFTLLCLAGGVLADPPVNAAQVNAPISDAAPPTFWHFDGDGRTYSDGFKPYFEMLDHGTTLLWDPTNRKITGSAVIRQNPKLQEIDIHMHGGGVPLKLDDHTSILWLQDNIEQTNFNSYYKIEIDGKDNGEFYLVSDEGSRHSESRFCCDNRDTPVESLQQEFDFTEGLYAVKLPTGRILLEVVSVDPSNITSITVIGLRQLPTSALSFGGRVFLIPRSLIASQLEAAGLDLRARYSVVQRAMSTATPVEQSMLAHPVKSSDFFNDSWRN